MLIKQKGQNSKWGHMQSKECHATSLPTVIKRATKADTFTNVPKLLMSVGKTSDDGTISIFTKTGVTVHKKQMYSSGAKGLRYSLEYRTNMDDTASHSSKKEGNGNQERHPK